MYVCINPRIVLRVKSSKYLFFWPCSNCFGGCYMPVCWEPSYWLPIQSRYSCILQYDNYYNNIILSTGRPTPSWWTAWPPLTWALSSPCTSTRSSPRWIRAIMYIEGTTYWRQSKNIIVLKVVFRIRFGLCMDPVLDATFAITLEAKFLFIFFPFFQIFIFHFRTVTNYRKTLFCPFHSIRPGSVLSVRIRVQIQETAWKL